MPEEIKTEQQPDNLTLVMAGLQRLEGEQKAFKDDHIRALAELKATVLQEVAEKTAKGYDSPETKAKLHSLEEAISKMEAAMLAPGATQRKSSDFVSPGSQLAVDKDFLEWKETGFRATKGNSGRQFAVKGGFFPIVDPWGEKATLTTSGLTPTMRQDGIIQLPRQELRIRDIMNVRGLATGNTVDYLKQNVFTNLASPQVEGSAKSESTLTYTTATATVRTLAHFINVTRQALDDVQGLRADVDSLLMYGLKLKEENEILVGDGTGQHLNGIVTQATAYATGTYNVAGDTRLDKIRHMILQCRLALFPCDGIVLNPSDMHTIELIKDQASNVGMYVIGNPRTGTEMTTLWGKPVVESDSLTAGQALVGAFRTGAELFDRMQAMIDISFEHASNFTENKATILAEERLALAVKRANSFIYGQIS